MIESNTPPPQTQQETPITIQQHVSPLTQEPTQSTPNELEADDIPSIHFKSMSPKTPFDMTPFKALIPEVVQQPHDIDGTKYYIIDVPEEDAMFLNTETQYTSR